MADRDKDLTHLFVRDLDDIDLPARDRWRPTPREESPLMRTGRYVLYAGAVAAVLVLAVVAGMGLRNDNAVVAPPSATATASPTPTVAATTAPVATASPTPTPATGAITGRFGYGSDFIPPVTVYAISTTDARVWYSVAFAGFGNPPRPTLPPGVSQPTYTISGVAPGTYWVVAYRNDGQLPDPGYYSRQVECSRTTPSGPCPDVSLVPATAIAGQTTSGIDVITWGPPPPGQASPTFPPRPTTR